MQDEIFFMLMEAEQEIRAPSILKMMKLADRQEYWKVQGHAGRHSNCLHHKTKIIETLSGHGKGKYSSKLIQLK